MLKEYGMELLQRLKKLAPQYPRDPYDVKSYSYDEALKMVQEHKTSWIIIDDYIVDLTNYIDKHPGGERVLQQNTGTDATTLFEKVCHSNEAYPDMLKRKIGKIKK